MRRIRFVPYCCTKKCAGRLRAANATRTIAAMSAKRLLMIMGVQRSGTSALFAALATAPMVTPRDESAADELYEDFFLRPEPQTRDVLAALPGTVLLKPVRESERRSPEEVSKEYADYDLTIIWLYRDPVNVMHSYLRHGWMRNANDAAATLFATEWDKRNRSAITARASLGPRLVVVRYEDLVAGRGVLPRLAHHLGLAINADFGEDTALGRRTLDPHLQAVIDRHVRTTLGALDSQRTTIPSVAASPSRVTNSTRVSIEESFFELMDAVDVGPVCAALHGDGRTHAAAGGGRLVVFGHDLATAVLRASRQPRPAWWPKEPPMRDGDVGRGSRCHPFNAVAWPMIIDRAVEGISDGCTVDIIRWSYALSVELAAAASGMERDVVEELFSFCRRRNVSDCDPGDPDWPLVLARIERSWADAAGGRSQAFNGQDVLSYLRTSVLPLQFLPATVANVLMFLGPRLTDVSAMRQPWADVVREVTRLQPIFRSVARVLVAPIEMGGLRAGPDTIIDVVVAAANRDPARFRDPNEFRPGRESEPPSIDACSPLGPSPGASPGAASPLAAAAVLVLERLAGGPRQLQVVEASRPTPFFLPDGRCLSAPRKVQVTFAS